MPFRRTNINNRLNHIASAKQTPVQTATELHRMSLRTEQEVELAGKTIPAENQEWKSTQTDLRILALLARYHGRKQLAADQLEAFYRDPRDGPLFTAQRELRGASAVCPASVAAPHRPPWHFPIPNRQAAAADC